MTIAVALVSMLAVMAVAYIWYAGVLNRASARALVRRGALLVDADPPDEFARDHVAGAVNIPIEDFSTRQPELGPPSRSIVVYAREEMRSAHAAHLLRELGYERVISAGAMDRWRAK